MCWLRAPGLAPINLGLALGAHGGHVYEIFSRSVPEKAARTDDRMRSFALRRGDTPRLPTTLTSGDLSTRRVNPDLALVALDPLVLLRTSLGLVADAATDDGDQRSEEGKLRHRQKNPQRDCRPWHFNRPIASQRTTYNAPSRHRRGRYEWQITRARSSPPAQPWRLTCKARVRPRVACMYRTTGTSAT